MAATSVRRETLVVSFDGHHDLSAVFGAQNENLRQLEDAFGVEVVSWGGSVSITGESGSCALVRDNLKALRARVAGGAKDVTVASVLAGSGDEALWVKPLRRGNRKGGDVEQGEQRAHEQPAYRQRIDETKPASQPTALVNLEPRQRELMAATLKSSLTFAVGAAGSGKTFAATMAACEHLRRGAVRRLVFVRPMVTAGESPGILPGTMREKIEPYFLPIFDSLAKHLGARQMRSAMEERRIELAPLAYLRGRTLENAFVVLDEAQNCTVDQMVMFLTRMGNLSRFCVTGDPSQRDLPRGVRSGLSDALRRLRSLAGVSVVEFTASDIVRHPLVADIVRAYQRGDNSNHNVSQDKTNGNTGMAARNHHGAAGARLARVAAQTPVEANTQGLEVLCSFASEQWQPQRAHWQRLAARCASCVMAAGAAGAADLADTSPRWELSVLFTDDAHIRRLNHHWRGIDKATNVLSFPAYSSDETKAPAGDQPAAELELSGSHTLGDVALSFDTLEREASDYGVNMAARFSHMMVHGILHLLGYDHADGAAAAAMEQMESKVMLRLGFDDPWSE